MIDEFNSLVPSNVAHVPPLLYPQKSPPMKREKGSLSLGRASLRTADKLTPRIPTHFSMEAILPWDYLHNRVEALFIMK